MGQLTPLRVNAGTNTLARRGGRHLRHRAPGSAGQLRGPLPGRRTGAQPRAVPVRPVWEGAADAHGRVAARTRRKLTGHLRVGGLQVVNGRHLLYLPAWSHLAGGAAMYALRGRLLTRSCRTTAQDVDLNTRASQKGRNTRQLLKEPASNRSGTVHACDTNEAF